VEPIAPELHVLRVTVGGEFVADLEAVRAALSHQLPGGRLEEILHHCLRVTLEGCRRRRRGAGRKATAAEPPAGSRYVPAAVREQVWARDGGACSFVAMDGRRCGSRHRLALHHIVPFGKGGATTVDNLTLRCQAHNLYAAERDYGRERIRGRGVAAR